MEPLMTTEEVAELLHVEPITIRRLVNKGVLSAYRIGADYRFALVDLQDYLQRQRITAHTQVDSASNLSNPFDQFLQWLRKVFQGKNPTPAELASHFDRFTNRATHVLTLAAEEAQHFQHTAIGSEHILLGLLREVEGVAVKVLTNLGIETTQVRQQVAANFILGETAGSVELGLTLGAKRVVELAVIEARSLNHHFVGTEHLLLGLMRESEGSAALVLSSLGLQLAQVRTETLRVLHSLQA
jgi:excisionase family DNA binding protein